ncbi:MAG: RNA-binding protein [Anderseniella sp.]
MAGLAQQTILEDDPNVRMCALTRAQRPRGELLRFVASPDGDLVPDLKENLPGRGVWLSLSRASVAEAVKRGVFARALKAQITLPDNLSDLVARLLLKDAMSCLSLASKAGQVVAGFEKTEATVVHGRAAVLIAASDGAEDGRRKLSGKLRAADQADRLVECFASADLDLALGRTNVIHAAINPGGLARKFMTCARRYELFELNGAAQAES